MCSAQDDLFKWGAVLFLRFLGQSGTPVPTEFGENFIFGSRTTGGRPYGRCIVLSFLIVGDDVLGVPFIKISLRFARATTWQAASFLRKHCSRPYEQKIKFLTNR